MNWREPAGPTAAAAAAANANTATTATAAAAPRPSPNLQFDMNFRVQRKSTISTSIGEGYQDLLHQGHLSICNINFNIFNIFDILTFFNILLILLILLTPL